MVLSNRGQGGFEYILLLAGVLLITVVGIVLFRGSLFSGAEQSLGETNCLRRLASVTACYNGTEWNACGQVLKANHQYGNGSYCVALTNPGGCAALQGGKDAWCGGNPGGSTQGASPAPPPPGKPSPSPPPRRAPPPLPPPPPCATPPPRSLPPLPPPPPPKGFRVGRGGAGFRLEL